MIISSYYGFLLFFYQIKDQPVKKKQLPSNLKNVDKKLANLILNEIVDSGPPVRFSDIGECYF